ncbi:hypothetical protein [Methylorubrum thiocyanatum]|uniref:hypothetical protein n=1 Tax=Methylorubrum thiocyanatum TaxID=47958 RepID=UPI00365E103F
MANSRARRGMQRRSGALGECHLRGRSCRKSLPASLPLVHATAAFTANEILRAGKLETRHCRVFKRDLLYFFVMRPDYRSREGGKSSHQLNVFPVVFIMRPEAADPLVHAYPFDTGAAAAGAFAEQADPLLPLEDYSLESSLSATVGHIEWAFGTLADYMDGHLRTDIREGVPRHETVTHGFVDVALMGRKLSNLHDRRASAVEVAVGNDIDLKGNILLAILPKQYLEDEAGPNAVVIERLKAHEILVETYDWRPNTSPDEYQQDITDLALAFFTKENLL